MNDFSVCIITKNEAGYLKECLQRLKRLGVQIVVADTGSTDESVEIAKAFGAKVAYYEWNDDFAAARNFVVSQADNDWILMVDTDEMLTGGDVRHITPDVNKVGRIELVNVFERDGEHSCTREHLSRFFNRKYFEYCGKVHEQLVRKDGRNFGTFNIPMKFEHLGYNGDPQTLRKKAERNIQLLLSELENDSCDPYILYQLGKSYYMMKDYEKAYEYFFRATSCDVDERLEYVADLVISYGYSMLNTGRKEEALLMENLIPEFGKSSDFFFLLGLIYMNNLLFEQAVEAFLEATKVKNAMVEGTDSYKAFYNVGVIMECTGHRDEAIRYYEKCGSYSKAKERLGEV